MLNRKIMSGVILSVLLLLTGCTGTKDAVADTGSKSHIAAQQENAPSSAPSKELTMKLTIDNTVVPVTWEHNSSTAALHKLLPLTIKLSPYGGFEQVGSIPLTTVILSFMRGTSWSFFMVPIPGPIRGWGILSCLSRK